LVFRVKKANQQKSFCYIWFSETKKQINKSHLFHVVFRVKKANQQKSFFFSFGFLFI